MPHKFPTKILVIMQVKGKPEDSPSEKVQQWQQINLIPNYDVGLGIS